MVEVVVLIPRKDEQNGVAKWSLRMLTTLVILAHSAAGRFRSTKLSSPSGEAYVMAVHRGSRPNRRAVFRCIAEVDIHNESQLYSGCRGCRISKPAVRKRILAVSVESHRSSQCSYSKTRCQLKALAAARESSKRKWCGWLTRSHR